MEVTEVVYNKDEMRRHSYCLCFTFPSFKSERLGRAAWPRSLVLGGSRRSKDGCHAYSAGIDGRSRLRTHHHQQQW